MGSKITAEKKRSTPLTLRELTLIDGAEPSKTEAVIIGREKLSFEKSAQAYANLLTKDRSAERLGRECEWFKTAYTTTHVQVTKKGESYWAVTTIHPKDTECIYLNQFKADGEILAESNYHPKVHTGEMMSNSTVLWCQYKYLQDQGIPWGPVKRLRRSDISNEQTNDTARVCFLLSEKMKGFPESWQMTWRPGDLMNTLVGTPNGRAGHFLVQDWGTELEITGIESISVEKKPAHANRQTELLITFVQDDGIEVPKGGF